MRVPLLPSVLLVLVLVLAPCASAQASSCRRTSAQEQKQSATFLCSVSVTMRRSAGCAATVSEEYVFPHTTGADAFRDIPRVRGVQNVSNVSATRDGAALPVRTSEREGVLRVYLATRRTGSAATFRVAYGLSNAAMRFSTACLDGQSADATRNVLRWGTGQWDKTLELVRVRFEAAAGGTAEAAGASVGASVVQKGGGSVTYEARGVRRGMEFYAMDGGEGGVCERSVTCLAERTGDGKEGTKTKLLLFGIGAALLVMVCCFVGCKCWGGKGKMHAMRRGSSGSTCDGEGWGCEGGGGEDCGGGGDGDGGDGGGGGG